MSQLSYELLVELSDIANCLSGEFHTMHLNITGADFDTMHKKTLKKYYEEAANDYDTFAEMARRKPWGTEVPPTNDSAKRLQWASATGPVTRKKAVERTDTILKEYLDSMNSVFKHMEKNEDCPVSQGIASWIQDRMNYWGSEWGFFNASRMEDSK
jgi:DNA-binding ferritin-like protein